MMKSSLIARLLGNSTTAPPAVKDVKQALDEVEIRRRQIRHRIAAIQPDNIQTGSPGPARERVLATGSPEELVELDQELTRLQAEMQQLDHRAQLLQGKLSDAQAAEAKAELPSLIRDLPAAADAIEKAREEAARAEARFRDAVSAVRDKRAKAGTDAPSVSPELADRLADLMGFDENPMPHKHSSARLSLFVSLGAGRTPKSDEDAGKPRSRPESPAAARRLASFLDAGGALRRADRP